MKSIKNYRVKLCLDNINNLFIKCMFNRINVNITNKEINYIVNGIYDLYADNRYLYNFNSEMDAYSSDVINNSIMDKRSVCVDSYIDGLIECHSMLPPYELPIDKYSKKLTKIKNDIDKWRD